MKLSKTEKEKIIERYTSRYKKYGYSPMTLGWGKGGRQNIRFSGLTDFIDLKNIDSILDIGCGFADLYRFVKNKGFKGKYVGIELVEILVKEAQKRYPETRIITGDFLTINLKEEFDLVIGSGIFNAKCHKNMYAYIKEVLKKLLSLSGLIAVDFMSVYVDYQREIAFHADPKKIIDLSHSLTKRFILRYDYMPYEFALFLYNNDSISENNVFVEYLKVMEDAV